MLGFVGMLATAPYVTLVQMTEPVAQQIVRQYDRQYEHLWCVTKFTETYTPDYRLITVVAIEEQQTLSSREHVPMSGSECVGENKQFLPMMHSHPDGSCQASPDDMNVILARYARFDGIICGPRYAAWYFASQLGQIDWTRPRQAAQ
jgi:proteasome lid subunit RPN8/RPN11